MRLLLKAMLTLESGREVRDEYASEKEKSTETDCTARLTIEFHGNRVTDENDDAAVAAAGDCISHTSADDFDNDSFTFRSRCR